MYITYLYNIEGPSYDGGSPLKAYPTGFRSLVSVYMDYLNFTPLASTVTQATNKLSATETLAAYILDIFEMNRKASH